MYAQPDPRQASPRRLTGRFLFFQQFWKPLKDRVGLPPAATELPGRTPAPSRIPGARGDLRPGEPRHGAAVALDLGSARWAREQGPGAPGPGRRRRRGDAVDGVAPPDRVVHAADAHAAERLVRAARTETSTSAIEPLTSGPAATAWARWVRSPPFPLDDRDADRGSRPPSGRPRMSDPPRMVLLVATHEGTTRDGYVRHR